MEDNTELFYLIPSLVYTAHEAREILAVNAACVNSLILRGKFKNIRIGDFHLLERESVHTYALSPKRTVEKRDISKKKISRLEKQSQGG